MQKHTSLNDPVHTDWEVRVQIVGLNDQSGEEEFIRVESIPVISLLLAGKSSYFKQVFSDWTLGSPKVVNVQIRDSDETIFRDLIRYMEDGLLELEASTRAEVLKVLLMAAKFDVQTCINLCCRSLAKLPMDSEAAMEYIALPSCGDAVLPLKDAGKDYLVKHFKYIKVWDLTLAGIKAILSSDELEADSEDSIFDYVVEWSENHFTDLEERRQVLSSLAPLIRFPLMTTFKLEVVANCTNFGGDVVKNAVVDALLFKALRRYRKDRLNGIQMFNGASSSLRERAYKRRPITVMDFERPYLHTMVYWDLKQQECLGLFPEGQIYSSLFGLPGGHGFALVCSCKSANEGSEPLFRFQLMKIGTLLTAGTYSVNVELAIRSKPSMEFVNLLKGKLTFKTADKKNAALGIPMPWSRFAADNPYFIDGFLYMRAEIAAL